MIERPIRDFASAADVALRVEKMFALQRRNR